MNIEMADAEVVLNGVLGSIDGQTVTLKALPTVYALSQNFPNPFNPTTTIGYSIPVSGHTSLAIYNLAGQKVRTLVNGMQAPSFYKVVWDGKNESGMTVATGTYFYKLVSGNYSKIVKMTLIK
jgi:flagellar hook assembly protein FlgD